MESFKDERDEWSSGAWESQEILRVARLIIPCLQGDEESFWMLLIEGHQS